MDVWWLAKIQQPTSSHRCMLVSGTDHVSVDFQKTRYTGYDQSQMSWILHIQASKISIC